MKEKYGFDITLLIFLIIVTNLIIMTMEKTNDKILEASISAIISYSIMTALRKIIH